MSKVGRNEPCPCNSGKKFKRCHGQIPSPEGAMFRLGTVSTQAKYAEINIPGLPGMNLSLVMQAGYKDASSLKNVSNLPGQYKVVFTLSKPGYALLSERRLSSSQQLSGDSHLAIAAPALAYANGQGYDYDQLKFEVSSDTGNLTFTGLPNEKGMLGKIETEPFQAEHFGDAGLRSVQAVSPALSGLSSYLDVPVNIHQIDVVELRTNTHRISFRSPFKDVIGWMPPLDKASPEQQKYVSLYREALNSTSSNYTFLCFYRIIEGLRYRREKLRAGVVAVALAKQRKPEAQPDELIPADRMDQKQWLDALYATPRDWDELALDAIFIQEVVGRRMRNLIDKGQEFHKLRNKIAHAVLDSGEEIISIDNGIDLEEVEKWLPICKFTARYLLKDSFPDIFTRQ